MPTPGSLFIRPPRSLAEQHPKAFYQLFRAFRNPTSLSLLQIADAIGDTKLSPESNLSRKIGFEKLSEPERNGILDRIFGKADVLTGGRRLQVAKMEHAAYFALLEMFAVDPASQDQARSDLEGTFKFWSCSVEHPGEVVFGKMSFAENPETRALEAKLKIVTLPRDNQIGGIENYTGFLVRISRTYIVILRNIATNDICLCVLSRFKFGEVGTDIHPRSVFAGRNRHILSLEGFDMGFDHGALFEAPIQLSLVDDVDELAKLDADLDIVAEGDPRVPPRIARKLKSMGGLHFL